MNEPERPEPITEGWTFVHIGFDGHPFPGIGQFVWKRGWHSTGRTVTVSHPSYPQQRHDFPVYTVAEGDTEVEFAAGEYSNTVWGFWVPADA